MTPHIAPARDMRFVINELALTPNTIHCRIDAKASAWSVGRLDPHRNRTSSKPR